MLEKEYEETKDKIIDLKTQNKKLLYIVKVQAEELKVLYNKIKILILNEVFQIALRLVIIPAILIRLVKTPTYKNKKEIINRIITASKALASYA